MATVLPVPANQRPNVEKGEKRRNYQKETNLFPPTATSTSAPLHNPNTPSLMLSPPQSASNASNLWNTHWNYVPSIWFTFR